MGWPWPRPMSNQRQRDATVPVQLGDVIGVCRQRRKVRLGYETTREKVRFSRLVVGDFRNIAAFDV